MFERINETKKINIKKVIDHCGIGDFIPVAQHMSKDNINFF